MKIKTVLVSLVFLLIFVAGAGCASPVTMSTSIFPDFVSVIAEIRPSVVAITTEVPVRFFGRQFTQEGAGSGWIIDESGIIVTNAHVVEGARNVTVTLEDGRTLPAESVSIDSVADLAVIKVNASGLAALPGCRSENGW